jgi:hypothetical protein
VPKAGLIIAVAVTLALSPAAGAREIVCDRWTDPDSHQAKQICRFVDGEQPAPPGVTAQPQPHQTPPRETPAGHRPASAAPCAETGAAVSAGSRPSAAVSTGADHAAALCGPGRAIGMHARMVRPAGTEARLRQGLFRPVSVPA